MVFANCAFLWRSKPIFKGILLRHHNHNVVKGLYWFSTSTVNFSDADKALPLVDQVKRSLQLVSSPVSVITCDGIEAGSVIGMTVTSAIPLSMNPPMLSFNVKLPSRFSSRLHQVKHCGVNLLAYSQMPCASLFSQPGHKAFKDEFEEIGKFTRLHNIPIISESNSSFLCQVHKVIEVADHEIWFVKILEVISKPNSQPCLLYHKRAYHQGPS
ncbi:hypothetical protein DSO57_1005768 [Entomophthora muscae]|uniref:Uncharacterized protein n=1 Tax=Entomophthora muscae TaxID=34485 RepID=A0ACC2U6P2_9FUNG|nr:hypothetical protein DSO57_1005768 [Entomophthora muscae]